jgi:hypothetical protein
VTRGGGSILSAVRISRWGVVSAVGVLRGAGRAGERHEVQALQLKRDSSPCLAGLAFGDADQQQREPAEQDVRADASPHAVEDRSEFEGALEVAEAAFGFEQVRVAQGDVLGRQVGV